MKIQYCQEVNFPELCKWIPRSSKQNYRVFHEADCIKCQLHEMSIFHGQGDSKMMAAQSLRTANTFLKKDKASIEEVVQVSRRHLTP